MDHFDASKPAAYCSSCQAIVNSLLVNREQIIEGDNGQPIELQTMVLIVCSNCEAAISNGDLLTR